VVVEHAHYMLFSGKLNNRFTGSWWSWPICHESSQNTRLILLESDERTAYS
jgi:hypothetical protein